MRYLHNKIILTVLIIPIWLLQSCVSEIMDDCPQWDNVRLHFAYTQEDGTDGFSENISSVDVFVFDENKNFYTQQTVPQTALNLFAGTILALEPGTYYYVCWANITGNSVYSGMDKTKGWDEGYLKYHPNNEGDRTFYAPQRAMQAGIEDFTLNLLQAPKYGVYEKEVEFTPTHWRIEVFVDGLEDKFNGEDVMPLIELTHMPEGYDFHMQPGNTMQNITLHANTISTVDGPKAFAGFYTPQFNPNGDTGINIRLGSDSETVVASLHLASFLQENNIPLPQYGKISKIVIEVKFIDSDVLITIPKWNTDDIDPDL